MSVEQVEAIVAAGQRSSTSSNLQMVSVVAVTEQPTRERLAVLCGNQEHIAAGAGLSGLVRRPRPIGSGLPVARV